MKLFELLQGRVRESKTEHQRDTSVSARALFLSTECGEVLKEVLRWSGHYGPVAQAEAPEKLARELCDVIWNVCDLANHFGFDLDVYMEEMLRTNATRTFKEL